MPQASGGVDLEELCIDVEGPDFVVFELFDASGEGKPHTVRIYCFI